VKFSIITPGFRNSAWLKLCIASVARTAWIPGLTGATLDSMIGSVGQFARSN